MFVARFVDPSRTWWFPVHWIASSVGAAMAVIALVVIVMFIERTSTQHFYIFGPTAGSHQILGLVVMAGVAGQIALGLVAHCTWQPWYTTRCWPDRVHHWVGRAVLLLACVNVFLGLWAAATPMWAHIVIGVWLALLLAAFINCTGSNRYKMRTRHEKAQDELEVPLLQHTAQ